MLIREEQQIAIRMRDVDGKYQYKTKTADNEGTRFAGPSRPIASVDEAKNLLRLYSKDSQPTIVTRKVVINEGPWEEVETSEIKLLAEILHKKQCHFNHIDQCDWDYSNTTSMHKNYEMKAKKWLDTINFETAKELLELL